MWMAEKKEELREEGERGKAEERDDLEEESERGES